MRVTHAHCFGKPRNTDTCQSIHDLRNIAAASPQLPREVGAGAGVLMPSDVRQVGRERYPASQVWNAANGYGLLDIRIGCVVKRGWEGGRRELR